MDLHLINTLDESEGLISQGIRQTAYFIHQVEINISKNINILNTKRFQAKIKKQFDIEPNSLWYFQAIEFKTYANLFS